MNRRTRTVSLLPLLLVAAVLGPGCRPSAPEPDPGRLADDYVDAWLEHYPSRATAAGRHEHDASLEDLSGPALAAWVELNHRTLEETRRLRSTKALEFDDELDLELLERQLERELFGLEVLRRPRRDPLFWTGIAGNATIFLLVREDLPEPQRLAAAEARARQIPRLVQQAVEALGAADDSELDPEIVALAARQARRSATFYREGLAAAGGGHQATSEGLAEAGAEAGAAVDHLADFLDDRAEGATGDGRHGDVYPALFRIVTGVERPVGEVLQDAERALVAKRTETAEYGRSVWAEVGMAGEPPADDRALVARLFERVAQDRASSVEAFVEDYRTLVRDSVAFVRERGLMTLPDRLPVRVDRSPSFFLGQSVGGVYPAGPWAGPDAETLLFLPTPPPDAPPEALDSFFRDFNHHFNVMITPHELVPGHTLQLVLAAHHPRKVRALFADGVYVEGWGTFCERLMLDLGWGGPLDRLAHLKKQLENIARTLVDIRVHTGGLQRDEVLALVRDEALQDEQFAGNMWIRAITGSPQLTYYFQGYDQVFGLYQDVRRQQGEEFDLRSFLDGMMELGPVPVRRYRERMLGADMR